MNSPPTRDELIGALIRHPDLTHKAANSRDVWTWIGGEPLAAEAQATIDQRLKELSSALAIEEEYREGGIWTLTCLDDDYPQRLQERLGARAPVLLHGFGERSLLAQGGTGVVGSRNLDADAEKATSDLAKVIAGAGRVLISGGARGADQIAMSAAAERGGSVVGVLTHPLTARMKESEVRTLAEDGRVCLVTPYSPDMGFTVANAMARNRIIYALTDCTVVIASDLEKGGSWAGATESLRWRLTRVAAWTGPGAGPGNQALVEKGALALSEVSQILDQEWLKSVDGFAGQQLDLLA